MRFESKQIAFSLASGSGAAFDCSSWREKSIQVTGAGVVNIEGTINGTTWSTLLGGTLTSPMLISMPETVELVKATWVSGTIDVWIAGLNSQTE